METSDLNFSQRIGVAPKTIPLQINDMDINLRTDLWNLYFDFIQRKIEQEQKARLNDLFQIIVRLWTLFLSKPIDELDSSGYNNRGWIKSFIMEKEWYEVYDLYEFLSKTVATSILKNKEKFTPYVNFFLQRNNAGYHLINHHFVPITNDIEIAEIQQTENKTQQLDLRNIASHLKSAIELLSLKPNPDNRNAVKESISMVETIARIIEPDENTLGKALNKLKKHKSINEQLVQGFEKLYAYTNGPDGIRHAMMDDSSVGIEEARFFLVSCSAFTNYLIEKALQLRLLSIKP